MANSPLYKDLQLPKRVKAIGFMAMGALWLGMLAMMLQYIFLDDGNNTFRAITMYILVIGCTLLLLFVILTGFMFINEKNKPALLPPGYRTINIRKRPYL